MIDRKPSHFGSKLSAPLGISGTDLASIGSTGGITGKRKPLLVADSPSFATGQRSSHALAFAGSPKSHRATATTTLLELRTGIEAYCETDKSDVFGTDTSLELRKLQLMKIIEQSKLHDQLHQLQVAFFDFLETLLIR